MGTVVSPFTNVPRQARKKEEGAGGLTAQAGCMQQGTPQGSPGKVDGVHGKWDLRVPPVRGCRGCTVFIIHDSFSSSVLRRVTAGTLPARLPVGYGVFTPYDAFGTPDGYGRRGQCCNGCGQRMFQITCGANLEHMSFVLHSPAPLEAEGGEGKRNGCWWL